MNLDQLVILAQTRFSNELKQGLSITKACAQVIYDEFNLRNFYLDPTKSIEDCLQVTSKAILVFVDFLFQNQHKLDGAVFGTDEVFTTLLDQILQNPASKRTADVDSYYSELHKAMLYSLSSTGKMLRPFIIILIASFNEDIDGGEAIITATALECVHTYSLIHDDLPEMDNDDYRRGKLTNHMVFGGDHAILAGDALQTLAFSLLTENEESGLKLKAAYHKVRYLALGAGMNGMCLGQSFDLLSESLFDDKSSTKNLDYVKSSKSSKSSESSELSNSSHSSNSSTSTSSSNISSLNFDNRRGRRCQDLIQKIKLSSSQATGILTELHYRKTAFLIRTAVMLGLCCTYDSLFNKLIIKPNSDKLFQQWALALGLAFQIKDDLLDVEGDMTETGKPVGSDDQNHKLTYVSLLGLDQTRQDLLTQMELAKSSLDIISQQIEEAYNRLSSTSFNTTTQSLDLSLNPNLRDSLINDNLALVNRLKLLTDFVVNRKK